ncbi:MAG TPA: M28 family peptidase [Thermoguttaceae bacterium]|nr:M28 family peptidase [Thermoguttaceae bacterium]
MDIDQEVTDRICGFPEALLPMRERLLANLVMIAQIPAPDGEEEQRARFLLDRFAEAGMVDAAADEVGNAVGRLYGKTGNRNILLVSHLDTIFPANLDHSVTVEADRVIGPGVGDNALGAAIISLMPAVLEHLGIELESNLILLGSIGSLGRGNHAGLRFFLDHLPDKVDFGICVEGMQLGRVNYFSIGTARGDIMCDVRQEHSRSYGTESALIVINHIINRILGIGTPDRPYTVVRLGRIRAGVAYDVEPDHAELGMEIVSHKDDMIDKIQHEIEDIVAEMSARHAVDAHMDLFFRTQAGGIPFSHPLVKCTLDVMHRLGVEPDQGHSPSELSELIARKIPAITLGISRGDRSRKKSPDYVLIDPILAGVAQLLGVILAIDEGTCDEV